MTGSLVHGERAAKLYALALALDNPLLIDGRDLVRQGVLLVQHGAEHNDGTVDAGLPTVHLLDAGATFLRAALRWVPEDQREDVVGQAERAEMLRDLVLATTPPEAA